MHHKWKAYKNVCSVNITSSPSSIWVCWNKKLGFFDQNFVFSRKYTHANSMQLSIHTDCIKFMNCFIKRAWMQSNILYTWRIVFNPLLFASHSLSFYSISFESYCKLLETFNLVDSVCRNLWIHQIFFPTFFFQSLAVIFSSLLLLISRNFIQKKMHLIKIPIYLKSCRAFKALKSCLPSKWKIHMRVGYVCLKIIIFTISIWCVW